RPRPLAPRCRASRRTRPTGCAATGRSTAKATNGGSGPRRTTGWDRVITEDNVGAVFTALADPTRRRVVELLREGPLRASDLAVASDTHPALTSTHLRVLRTVSLAEVEPRAHHTRDPVYRLRHDRNVPR